MTYTGRPTFLWMNFLVKKLSLKMLCAISPERRFLHSADHGYISETENFELLRKVGHGNVKSCLCVRRISRERTKAGNVVWSVRLYRHWRRDPGVLHRISAGQKTAENSSAGAGRLQHDLQTYSFQNDSIKFFLEKYFYL